MSNAMIETTKELVKQTHATIGYVQSDEISLVWIPGEGSPGWFDNKTMKMTSVLAGLATAAFCQALFWFFRDDTAADLLVKLPHFDARVISMPSTTEAANMLLWRNLDATKNAISMAASHYYSHRALQGKSGAEKQEMLFQRGQNFNDYPAFFKRGTWVRRQARERLLTAAELAAIPMPFRPPEDQPLVRSEVVAFDLPPLNRVSNRVDVLFHGHDAVKF
jgi:tRNA(His) 5'-end guanylyltransferase